MLHCLVLRIMNGIIVSKEVKYLGPSQIHIGLSDNLKAVGVPN
jgi:hypothetical protein